MGKQVVSIHIKKKRFEDRHTASITIYDTKDVDGVRYKMNPLEHIENLEVKHKSIKDLAHINYVEYNKRRFYFPYVGSNVGEGIYTCIKVEPTNWFRRLIWKLFSINPLF